MNSTEGRFRRSGIALATAAAFAFAVGTTVSQTTPTDPGVRGGPAGAGGPLPGLKFTEQQFFKQGQVEFQEVQSVQGTIPDTEAGLGPRFNLDNCAGCHAQPAVGGSSPAVNPQVAMATKEGATNTVPFFITINGPVREARLKYKPDGSRDGGVHGVFVISGRSDAPGCNIVQPNFDAAAAANNLIFRIPIPVFGSGLIEMIPDSTILANKNANLAQKQALGIAGHENREGNTGTITRVGWKAQNKSLLMFSGEAYNVEQGVTNELFQDERDQTPSCLFNTLPEDPTNMLMTKIMDVPSSIELFAIFQRLLAPPTPVTTTFTTANGTVVSAASIANGRSLFSSIGCALCHTPTLMTGPTSVAALSNKAANLFSDVLVHHMGPGLADDIIQGIAGPDEFRTAPLWGLGQRLFFLHDGRTSNLLDAIYAHRSDANAQFPASEANAVINNFDALTTVQKQDIVNFLRSL